MIAVIILVFVFCALRLGAVGLMSMLMVFHLWVFYPVTTEVTAWYASTFVMISIVVLAMSTYAFYISLGGQKILSGKLLEEG